MTFETSVNGDTRIIVVETNSPHTMSRWGDQTLTLDVRETEPGIYSVTHEGRSVTVTMGENGWAEAAGRVFQTEVTDPRNATAGKGAAGRGGQIKLTSPMPGKVIRILVQAGDAVTAGQGLVVVEAMKMQNEMKAPRDAKVVAIKTQETATVGAGEVLLILE
jgi:biotin carboxyl carrier protein